MYQQTKVASIELDRGYCPKAQNLVSCKYIEISICLVEMKDFLKVTLVVVFVLVSVSFMLELFVRRPEIKEESPEEVLQAEDVVVSGFIRLQEIRFKVYPEKRVPSINNWDTRADFQVQNQSTHAVVFQRNLVQTDTGGIGTIHLTSAENIPDGYYSVYIKGISHLSRRYDSIHFDQISEYYDFTPFGDHLAGDTHVSRDDFINSLDISLLLTNLNMSHYICDLNQDSLVNSLDLSNQLYNISMWGDG